MWLMKSKVKVSLPLQISLRYLTATKSNHNWSTKTSMIRLLNLKMLTSLQRKKALTPYQLFSSTRSHPPVLKMSKSKRTVLRMTFLWLSNPCSQLPRRMWKWLASPREPIYSSLTHKAQASIPPWSTSCTQLRTSRSSLTKRWRKTRRVSLVVMGILKWTKKLIKRGTTMWARAQIDRSKLAKRKWVDFCKRRSIAAWM